MSSELTSEYRMNLSNASIGFVSALGFAWPFVTMFVGDDVSKCGFSFSSWYCAGHGALWLIYPFMFWIEFLLFFVATLFLESSYLLMFLYVVWAYFIVYEYALFLLGIPTLFWILAAVVDGYSFANEHFLWMFITNICLWAIIVIAHKIFMGDLTIYSGVFLPRSADLSDNCYCKCLDTDCTEMDPECECLKLDRHLDWKANNQVKT